MESLDKHYSQREKNLKVLRALPTQWDMKVVAMRESKDLSKTSTFELFSDLMAFEFDIDRRKDEDPIFKSCSSYSPNCRVWSSCRL
ncbi:hypothetical protein ACS0TY_035594 [Phlomoides rotata]